MIASASGARIETESVEVAPEELSMEEGVSIHDYPNPASADNLNLTLGGMEESPVEVRLVDQLGRELFAQVYENPGLASAQQLILPPSAQGGVYIVMVNQGQRQLRKKVIVRK